MLSLSKWANQDESHSSGRELLVLGRFATKPLLHCVDHRGQLVLFHPRERSQGRGGQPSCPYAQLKGSWSSMKNGKPLFHHVLQCVSCWKKELPDGDRRQGRR